MSVLSSPMNVALAGSGQLYPGYIGALWCLKDYGIPVAELSTTSGGAIVGGAVSSGYVPGPELVRIAKETLPLRNGLFDPSISAIRQWGLMHGDRIEDKFRELLVPTFGETELPLYVTSANVSRHRRQIWSTSATPEMELARAIRMSISLPIIFKPVLHENQLHVDGGIALNVPTTVFTNGLPVLAISFSRVDPIRKFLQYLEAILNTLLDSASVDAPNVRQLRIDVGYSGFNYLIGPNDVDRMVEKAYLATEKWILDEM